MLQEDVEGVRLTLLHYGLDQSLADWQPVVREPTAADLDAMFAPFDADLVYYGHHHAASDLQGRARYLSPGSLGCSAVPEARILVIECEAGEYRLRKGAVGYDDRPLFEAFEQRDVPEREFIRTVFFSR